MTHFILGLVLDGLIRIFGERAAALVVPARSFEPGGRRPRPAPESRGKP